METITGTFEMQIDEKPTGMVIRLNSDNGCFLRISGLPREMVYEKVDDVDKIKDFIDIAVKTIE